jgi:hypothetical protein
MDYEALKRRRKGTRINLFVPAVVHDAILKNAAWYTNGDVHEWLRRAGVEYEPEGKPAAADNHEANDDAFSV